MQEKGEEQEISWVFQDSSKLLNDFICFSNELYPALLNDSRQLRKKNLHINVQPKEQEIQSQNKEDNQKPEYSQASCLRMANWRLAAD